MVTPRRQSRLKCGARLAAPPAPRLRDCRAQSHSSSPRSSARGAACSSRRACLTETGELEFGRHSPPVPTGAPCCDCERTPQRQRARRAHGSTALATCSDPRQTVRRLGSRGHVSATGRLFSRPPSRLAPTGTRRNALWRPPCAPLATAHQGGGDSIRAATAPLELAKIF